MKSVLKVSLLKTSMVVFLFLLSAKALNFFKKILIGNLFGVSWVADAFFAASYLPYYLAIFFEGILFLGFLPLFSQVVTEKGKEEAHQFVSEVLLLILVLTGALVGLAWWGAPWIVRELVPGFNATEQALTQSLFQILSLVVVLMSLTSLFKALNSYFEDYALAASSGLMDTAVTVGLMLVACPFWGIHGAAWASLAGAVTALTFQAFFLFRKHLVFSARLAVRSVWLKKLFYFLLPMGLIWGFQQIPIVILNRFGSGMWEGTISALSISHTLTTVPMGLVSHTVLFAIFPSLAKQANGNGEVHAQATFFQTLRGGFLILVPVGFLLSGFARPLAALFFDGGGVAAEGTRRIANSLVCFGWATFALYADLFMTQSLIAVRRPAPAILLCASRAFLTYSIGYVLSYYWDYQGLALSFSLALAANFFLCFPVFFQMSPFRRGWKALFGYTSKLVLASTTILVLGWLIHQWSTTQWSALPDGILVLVLGFGSLAGIGLYLGILSWLRVEEIRSVWQGLKQVGVERRWWLADPNE